MLQAVVLVLLGGALGSVARYLVTHFSSEATQHHGFPYGTLIVNVVGSFVVGYILAWSADHTHDRWRLFAATGFCGGFTTFSAFAYESMAYWHTSQISALLINIILNNMLSFVAVILGIRSHSS